MDELGPATVDEMVLAWLQAEIESPRFQASIVGSPPNQAMLALVRQLVQQPNLADAHQNSQRRDFLARSRGFGRGAYIFAGLADDITWRRVRVTAAEVGQMLYANNVATWMTLAPRTRTVAEGASNVGTLSTGDDTNLHILSLARVICHSDAPIPFSEIIGLDRPDGRIQLMEGHSRATAYVLEEHRLAAGVLALIGNGPSVANWAWL